MLLKAMVQLWICPAVLVARGFESGEVDWVDDATFAEHQLSEVEPLNEEFHDGDLLVFEAKRILGGLCKGGCPVGALEVCDICT